MSLFSGRLAGSLMCGVERTCRDEPGTKCSIVEHLDCVFVEATHRF